MSRLLRAMLAAAVSATLLSSCTTLNANSLPQPGDNYRDGYDVIVEFSNVLNLPERAKVVMDGTPVGVVTKVNISSSAVDVTARIDRDVEVPSNVHAILQQATVLGDIYVALERPQETGQPAPALHPGARILVAQTTSPPQIEDTIANLANFVASGSIQRAQNAVVNINSVTPSAAGELNQIASRVATDLGDLSKNVDLVDLWLTGLSGAGNVMATRTTAFQFWFSDVGIRGFNRNILVANSMGRLLPSVGSVYSGGYWLVPMMTSVATATESIQHAKWSIEDELPKWRRLFTDYFMPQDKYPAINITSIVGPDGREMSGDTEQVLRMLGAIP